MTPTTAQQLLADALHERANANPQYAMPVRRDDRDEEEDREAWDAANTCDRFE